MSNLYDFTNSINWKTYKAWSSLAKQQDVEGSNRRVILSLLLDHSFFLAISSIFKSPNPEETFEEVKKSLEMAISMEKSEEHMSH